MQIIRPYSKLYMKNILIGKSINKLTSPLSTPTTEDYHEVENYIMSKETTDLGILHESMLIIKVYIQILKRMEEENIVVLVKCTHLLKTYIKSVILQL
jgi:hypothetical protein